MMRTSTAARSRPARLRGSFAQAVVEFALVAPLFFLLLFSIIDFGRYVYYVQILNNAAREGARYAIVHGSSSLAPSGPAAPGTASVDPSGDNVRAVVRNYAIGVTGNSTALTISPSWLDDNGNPGDNGRGQRVTVIVTYSFNSLIPVVPIPAIQIEGASTLVINN